MRVNFVCLKCKKKIFVDHDVKSLGYEGLDNVDYENPIVKSISLKTICSCGNEMINTEEFNKSVLDNLTFNMECINTESGLFFKTIIDDVIKFISFDGNIEYSNPLYPKYDPAICDRYGKIMEDMSKEPHEYHTYKDNNNHTMLVYDLDTGLVVVDTNTEEKWVIHGVKYTANYRLEEKYKGLRGL